MKLPLILVMATIAVCSAVTIDPAPSRVSDRLEPIRQKYKLPGLAGAIAERITGEA